MNDRAFHPHVQTVLAYLKTGFVSGLKRATGATLVGRFERSLAVEDSRHGLAYALRSLHESRIQFFLRKQNAFREIVWQTIV
jgi:hypothetical protein